MKLIDAYAKLRQLKVTITMLQTQDVAAYLNISIHHLQPSFFFGFEERNNGLIKIATPEKALIDILYLSPAKSRLFHSLPELELPNTFRISVAKKIIKQIPSTRRRSLVEKRFQEILD